MIFYFVCLFLFDYFFYSFFFFKFILLLLRKTSVSIHIITLYISMIRAENYSRLTVVEEIIWRRERLSCDFVRHNYETLKWLSTLPTLMQASFWW